MESKKPEGTEKETKTQAELDRACLGVLLLLVGIGVSVVGGFFYAMDGGPHDTGLGVPVLLVGISMIVAGITCLVKKPKNPSENE